MLSLSRVRHRLLQYGYLMPFAVLAGYGLVVVWGWKAGNATLVQPRSYDAVLPANAAACLLLLGLTPLALGFGWIRTGLALGLAATVLAWATLMQAPLGLNLHIDNLLVRHESLIAGDNVARMPPVLALVFILSGLLLIWRAIRPYEARRPILFALLGSLTAAYGLTGLLAGHTNLSTIELWQAYARLGPHTALALLVLGGALIILAARDSDNGPAPGIGPRWLWLPIVVCSLTVTFTFWIALRQRELAYINSTTQLTINNIAALFSGEAEANIADLTRLTRRWSHTPDLTQEEWLDETAEYFGEGGSCHFIQWVDAGLHNRWYWPHLGNEDAPFYDHTADPIRRAAVQASVRSADVAIAAPLESPLQSPSFAVYVPMNPGTSTNAFVVGEFFYDRFFDTIDRRLNLSRRYQLVVAVRPSLTPDQADPGLKVYEAMTPDEEVDARLHQSAIYNILGQRLTITLTPRPVFLAANRQYLPEVALISGLGVSLLFGLVVNLAQSARLRQRAAEITSKQLRLENEERRRIEDRLKTADERLNLAFESTQVGVYEWDIETDQVYCTPSIWKIIGYDPAEMPTTGQGWLGLLHADDQPAVRAVIETHIRGETPLIEIEHCILHHTGEWLWIALRAKCTTFGPGKRPLRVLGTIQNINARKRADEALRASQAESRKLSLVASKTDNAVIITDSQGHIEWANESYARLTGRRLAEVTGRTLPEMLASPDNDAGAVGRITTALAARESITIDVVQLATADRRFYVHLDVQPVLGEEGHVENFIAIETDITARVETELQLRRAKSEADAASRAKSEFLASMSHEIRTPMNGVIGMTSLLLETDLTTEQRDFVSTIRTSGDALLSIINEILDFSKIESGKMELEYQPFELSQCVEEAIDIFAAQAAAKNIELAYAIDPHVPGCILGDITRLRQILVNLMNNAVKFTPSGFITLEVSLAAATIAKPAEENILLDFHVTDTGIGIPADRQDLLFKPFTQVDSSTTRKYGGTGLGLAICDRLSQLMGGSIDVKSTLGQGSRFHFCIQTQAINILDHDTPPLFAALPVGSTVLAVDDHPVNRTMLDNCLKNWRLEPLIATDSAEALAMAEKAETLSAAIIDHDLAGIDGLDLVAVLRKLHPGLPVILLTASSATSNHYPEASNDPFIFRLAKPIKPYPLHDTLRHIMSGTRVTTRVAMTIPAERLADSIPLAILLVEDNPVNQKVAMRYLEHMGYQAATATNGVEALRAIEQNRYDLLFMDCQMPEMDGYTATREIRTRLPKNRQPIIVALTANAMQGDRERCLDAGMNDYITKPVKIAEIQSVITRFFGPKGD